jgi:hypothetical protein
MNVRPLAFYGFICAFLLASIPSCSTLDIVESPKTAYVSESADEKTPEVIWTSRTLTQNFDYLGQIKTRGWSYESALDRLIEGGKQLKADAIIDVHYETIGFLNVLHAFAIKFK